MTFHITPLKLLIIINYSIFSPTPSPDHIYSTKYIISICKNVITHISFHHPMSTTRGVAVFSNNKHLNIKQLTAAGFLIYFTDIQMITNYRRAIKYNYRKHSQKHGLIARPSGHISIYPVGPPRLIPPC